MGSQEMGGWYNVKVVGCFGQRTGPGRDGNSQPEGIMEGNGTGTRGRPEARKADREGGGAADGVDRTRRASMRGEDGDGKELNLADAKRYSGLGARANYVCPKAARSFLSRKREKDWVLLKRIASHLVRAPELVVEYMFEQSMSNGIVVHTDSVLGSYRTTWRSTSRSVLCVRGPCCQDMECDAGSRSALSLCRRRSLAIAARFRVGIGPIRPDAPVACSAIDRKGAGCEA